MIKTNYNGSLEEPIITRQFVDHLAEMMEQDEKLVYLDADLMFAWVMDDLLERFPGRMIHCGIAECNMVSVAAGMSAAGLKPLIHSFAVFISRRVFDQIYLSGAYGRNSMNIIGSQPGYTQGYNGGTHMAFEDIAMMRTVPDACVFDMVDGVQFNHLIEQTKDMNGIYYYRTALQDNISIYEKGSDFTIGKGIILREGTDATVIACGRLVANALRAAELLLDEGISIRVVDMFTIKPLDEELVIDSAKKTGIIVTAENHSVYGGLGSAVAETLAEHDPVPVYRIGMKDRFGEVGPEPYLEEAFGFTAEDVARTVREAVRKKSD
ncbi:transketolase family protein [Diplocloster hominis]|uniref:transketolase family protein n=1 Tax=Diplocloster hominis TaxID=3079010 RepID=UPI0031BB75EA